MMVKATMNELQTRKGIRRTTIILALVALAFYGGFILLGVLRA
jgi:hypothetical protein